MSAKDDTYLVYIVFCINIIVRYVALFK